MIFCESEVKKNKVGRRPLIQRQIFTYYSQQIVQGTLKPGDKLPVRETLIEQFDTTSNTIQRAIDWLVKDGLLTTEPRKGTFVSKHPACLYRIGIVLPFGHKKDGWRGLDNSLLQVAESIEQTTPYRFHIYDGMLNQERLNTEIVEQLESDFSLGRLAGIIFASNPYYLKKSPIITHPTFPRISIQSPGDKKHFPHISLKTGSIVQAAVDHLVNNGCNNIALIMADSGPNEQIELFQLALANHRMVYDPAWVLGVSLARPQWATNQTRLLLNPNSRHHPDGILILDDTLLEHVIAGIPPLDRDNRPLPRIMSLYNFSGQFNDNPHVERIGFDITKLMKECLHALEQQRNGSHDLAHTELLPFVGNSQS